MSEDLPWPEEWDEVVEKGVRMTDVACNEAHFQSLLLIITINQLDLISQTFN